MFTEAGLRCLTCQEFDDEDDDYYYSGNFQKSFEVGSFTGLEIGDDFIINLKQSDSFSINLSGEEAFVEEVQVTNDGGLLKIGYDGDRYSIRKKDRGVEVNIEAPDLQELYFSGVSKAYLNDFDLSSLKMVLSGVSVTEGALAINDKLDIEMKGAAKLTLEGKGGYLNARLSGGSVLNSLYYEAANVEIEADGASSAKVYASNTLNASSRGSSEIQYRGEPGTTNLDEDTGSSISEY